MASVEQIQGSETTADRGREHRRRRGRPPRREALLHDSRPRPVRRDRVGDARRDHPGPRRPGLRAARRRVPEVLVADRDEHRRAEVLPRPPLLAGARVEREADDRPRRRHGRRLGQAGRLLRRHGRGRDVRGRAEGDPRQPVRLVQHPGLVQRRLRGDAAVLGLLHPLDRRLDGVDPRLDPARGRHLPRRLGLGRQPLPPALVEGAALEGRLRLRPGLVHARRRRVRRHDQVGRQDAARGEDGRPRRRPSRHRGVHLVQGQGGAQGARPRAGRLRHVARLARLGLDPVPEREQLRPRQRRLHGGSDEGRGVQPHRPHRRHRRRDGRRARPAAPDRGGGLGVRRSGRAVRHDDQLVAHAPEHGPHQRVEPVLGVHVDRRLGVQPRVAQPDEVPPRGRRARRRGVRARGRRRLPRAGDPRRLLVLSDARDRAEREAVPPARARLREPRRAADGARPAVRLRRGTRVRGGDHRPHDGSRLPQVGGDRRADGAVRRLPGEPRADDRRDREAPRGGRQHRARRLRPGRPARPLPQGVGRRARPRRDPRLPQRAGDRARADRDDQLHDGLRHDRRRAGLLARQVEEARRRRRDHDRQQDRADGARAARLRAGARSTRSLRSSTSETRSSARRTSRPSTTRSSTAPSASARSTTSVT